MRKFEHGASRTAKTFTVAEKGFKSGFQAFNNPARDRKFFLVDEERGVVMSRGFIDHDRALDGFGSPTAPTNIQYFREPQTRSFLESFKIKTGMITLR